MQSDRIIAHKYPILYTITEMWWPMTKEFGVLMMLILLLISFPMYQPPNYFTTPGKVYILLSYLSLFTAVHYSEITLQAH